jgi:sortase A
MASHLRSRWLEQGLLTIGILLLASWTHVSLESRAFQAKASRELELALRAAETGRSPTTLSTAAVMGPSGSAPTGETRSQGVLGRLEIPRLGITAIVAEGTDTKTLGRAVGHVPSTALPGSPGNCGLAGHRDTFLRGLGGVRPDDVIRIVTLEGTYTYQVDWTEVVEPDRVDTLDPTATPSVTLITCYPFAFVGHAPQRFVVRARQVEGR